MIPTVAYPPPKLGAKEIYSTEFQNRAFSLSSIASISGCCQVTIPLGLHDKCPLAVSFIARHGGDRFLLDTLQSLYVTLQEKADLASKPKGSKSTVTIEESAEMAKEKARHNK